MEEERDMDTAKTCETSRALFDRYQAYLASLPSPGGNGCHVALLGAANLGVLCGLSAQQIYDDLRGSIPRGTRPVSDHEIFDAINRAIADHNGNVQVPIKPKPVINNGPVVLTRLLAEGQGLTDADLWECSPVRIDWPPQEDAARVLSILYSDDDLIFVGDRHQAGILGETIRTVREWIAYLQQGGPTAPHIIPSPLTGKAVQKKSGDGLTLRGDGCIAAFRFALVEFDGIGREDQIAFWASANLPVSALIDSGGKSIHGWLDVCQLATVTTLEEWQTHIGQRLYRQVLQPMGVDGACKNAARLSRLPGHFRAEKERTQRILYLSTPGRRVMK